MDLRNTLANLKYLLLYLTSPSREIVPPLLRRRRSQPFPINKAKQKVVESGEEGYNSVDVMSPLFRPQAL